jgi:hypothetical protein
MLKRLNNGQYKVTSKKEAVEALSTMAELTTEILALMAEHGITEMQEDATELKKAATRWAAQNEVARIDLPDGSHATLRRDKYGGHWIATDDDLTTDDAASAVPLLRILRKKYKNKVTRSEIWNRVTRRQVDSDALQRVIAEGILTAEEVAPAYAEKEKAPFLIVYGG